MGKLIDFDHPLSDEDKDYLRSRGRAGQIIENERRFGEDGNGGTAAENPDLDGPGQAESATFDPAERDDTDYDVGGAPLPGKVLDADTGRVIPLEARSEFPHESENGPEFDADIIDYVESLKVAELKDVLKKRDVAFKSADDKDELQNHLIESLQEGREKGESEGVPDEFTQNVRNVGNEDPNKDLPGGDDDADDDPDTGEALDESQEFDTSK